MRMRVTVSVVVVRADDEQRRRQRRVTAEPIWMARQFGPVGSRNAQIRHNEPSMHEESRP